MSLGRRDDASPELGGAAGAHVVVYAEGAEEPSGASFVAGRAEVDHVGTAGTPRVAIGGEEFAARSFPLEGLDRTVVGRLVILRSLDRELSALRSVQTALLWVGATAVILAVGANTVLARGITRPVAGFVTAGALAPGPDAVVPCVYDDEIGALADAFRAMVRELKEKADMEVYLASVVRGAAVAASSPGAGESAATMTNAGQVLAGRFELGPELGSGGVGTVYLAFDRTVGERVALKVLKAGAGSPERSEHFVHEVRLARRITHRNVVRTHDIVTLDTGWALSMEYVEGMSLATLMQRGRLPFAAALGIARQIAAGLEAAHAQGIVHRDLKPGNVLLDGRGVAKIADFGLAQIQGSGVAQAHGRIAGTPLYMSPEQAQGRTADARSDVYAAGVVFFQLFCGAPPFDAPTTGELLERHIHRPPPQPRALRADLPEDIELVILRALEKAPEARFASAGELSLALRAKKRAGVATGPFHERPELS